MNYGDAALGVECALPAGFEFNKPKRKYALRLLAAFALAGAALFGQGAYIHAKAWVAQQLLERAWELTLAGDRDVKPWPWADTHPVARLIVPGHKQSLFILSGASGRTIAFGPGHMDGTPLPGDAGESVIGGHRDTHLAFLRDLGPGDELAIERPDGKRVRYRVTDIDVLDKRDTWVARNEGPTRLTLITCWPFEALRAGGSQRYVVIARRIRT
jgi:sortase A